jgi:integrase/recombinase XerC
MSKVFMAKIYEHKHHGLQLRFTIYFPEGKVVRYRFSRSRDEMYSMHRAAETLEIATRRCDASFREVEVAVNLGLISSSEAALLTGGKRSSSYDLDLIIERWTVSDSLVNSPYGHEVNMRRGKRLRLWLESNPIPKIDEADVKRYIQRRRDGLLTYPHPRTGITVVGCSTKTITNELQILRSIIDEAVKLKMVDVNVARTVDLPVKKSKFRRSMSMDEVSALLEAARQSSHLCHGYAVEVLSCAVYAGLRRSEIRTLQWRDIDFDNGRIRIVQKAVPGEEDFIPKGGNAGVTTMPDRLAEILGKLERKGDWVFGGEKPLVLTAFWQLFKEVASRAGLPSDLSLHHARHTYGSWLLRMTGDLSYVQSEMRHTDINTTRNYMHTTASEKPARLLDFGDKKKD